MPQTTKQCKNRMKKAETKRVLQKQSLAALCLTPGRLLGCPERLQSLQLGCCSAAEACCVPGSRTRALSSTLTMPRRGQPHPESRQAGPASSALWAPLGQVVGWGRRKSTWLQSQAPISEMHTLPNLKMCLLSSVLQAALRGHRGISLGSCLGSWSSQMEKACPPVGAAGSKHTCSRD